MYKSVILKDGTMGELKLPYTIPNFKFPLRINAKTFVEFTNDVVEYSDKTLAKYKIRSK